MTIRGETVKFAKKRDEYSEAFESKQVQRRRSKQ